MYCAGLGLGGSGRERPGPWLPQAIRASARVRGAAGVCAYPAQAPPPGGNGGGAAASDNAAGDDLYGAGMGVPTTDLKRPRLRVIARPGPIQWLNVNESVRQFVLT